MVKSFERLRSKLIWLSWGRHGKTVIIVTAMMIVAFLEMDIIGHHGWVMMDVTTIMAGDDWAMIGIMAMMVFAWRSSVFVFVYITFHG